ncbi:MAG: UvrD-helicase domain-containing protein [Clostridia bacterium]|nr:UvrD-helicase domain-containing protein [Clostridia bacterium]
MAEIKLTEAQAKAVHHGDGNLLISAAAGSGKTATLSTRIAELVITGRGKLSRMLIVTFTRASAGEMRERISRKLHEAAEKYRGQDPEISGRINLALAEIPSAEISTIHSFLYKALKPYFGTLGISSDARIVEQQVADSLRRECMKSVVDDFFDKTGEEGADFADLADVIGQVRDTSTVDGELLWLANALQASGENETILHKYAERLDEIRRGDRDPMASEFGAQIRETLKEFAVHYRKVLEYYGEEMPWEEEVWKKYGENHGWMLEWLRSLEELLADESTGLDALARHFGDYAPPTLGRLAAKNRTELSDRFKAHRDDMKKDIGRLAENFFSSGCEEVRFAAGKTASVLRQAAAVLKEYFRKLSARKRSLSAIDYNDLEEFGTKLFLNDDGTVTETAKEVGGKYDWIFIDEYQDTNRVQDRIFCAVSGNASRFIVGDIKQSIYRFRGANPEVFAEYRRSWTGGDDGESLFMSENFRCDRCVIDFVNLISGYTLAKSPIPYEKEDELVYAKQSETESVPAEVCLIVKNTGEEVDKYTSDISERNPEAWYVAGRIRDMIGRYSPDGKSILQPADVAVILRSPSSTGQDYIDALAYHGIPAAMKTSKSLDEYTSVMLLLCILRTVNNPLEDVYLAGALRSPLFGFTSDDLIQLRENAGEMPLYFGLTNRVETEDENNGEKAKCTKTVEWIKEQRALADGMSVEKYLEQLIETADIRGMEGIRGNGSEVDAVRKFAALAKTYENTTSDGRVGIAGFLDYLENALESAESNQTSVQPDSVQVISIHSSKGLEYPVVFLSECAKQRNTQDEQRTMLYDWQMGMGMYITDSTGLTRSDNLIRRAIGEKIRSESVAEEMRMLYVALTRARNRLIVTAKTKDADQDLRDAEWDAAFGDSWSVSRCRSYAEWILQACALCKNDKPFRISVIEPDDADEENAGLGMAEESCEYESVNEEAETLLSGFEYEYEWEYLENIPAKLTVSRLKPEILDEYEMNTVTESQEPDPEETEMRMPIFMTGEAENSGRERGNATHKFMQFVRFEALKEYGYETEKNRLISEGYLSEREAGLINLQQIRRFTESVLLGKILRSEFVKREFRFNHRMPAADFTESEEKKRKLDENCVKITVQGVVDCVFRDPDTGKLVLIDYKTDSLTAEEWKDRGKAEEKLRSRHRNQLSYYGKICSELFGEEIEGVYIYSTVLGKMIEI